MRNRTSPQLVGGTFDPLSAMRTADKKGPGEKAVTGGAPLCQSPTSVTAPSLNVGETVDPPVILQQQTTLLGRPTSVGGLTSTATVPRLSRPGESLAPTTSAHGGPAGVGRGVFMHPERTGSTTPREIAVANSANGGGGAEAPNLQSGMGNMSWTNMRKREGLLGRKYLAAQQSGEVLGRGQQRGDDAGAGQNSIVTSTLKNSFKQSFDSAANKLSKYAISAASHIKAIAQQVSEPRVSSFEGVVSRDLIDAINNRRPVCVPEGWVRKFRCQPLYEIVSDDCLTKVKVLGETDRLGLRSLYDPSPDEVTDMVFPRAIMIVDQVLRRHNSPICKSESLMEVEMNDHKGLMQIGGKLIFTSHRIFFDASQFDVENVGHRWLIRDSNLISLHWAQIKAIMTFPEWLNIDNSEPCSSPTTLPPQTAISCFIDCQLRDSTSVGFYIQAHATPTDCSSSSTLLNNIMTAIRKRLFPPSLFHLPAFTPAVSRQAQNYAYYSQFNPWREYARMGALSDSSSVILNEINLDYKVCETYPPLLPLPKCMSDSDVYERHSGLVTASLS